MKQTITKMLSVTLVCALLTGCAAKPVSKQNEAEQPTQSAEEPVKDDQNVVEETVANDSLPSVGEVFSGFEVMEIIPMGALGSTGILYQHNQSGAELLYLKNEDINRSFDLSFRTPALDEKGKPHVFEHVTICGSQKYPDPNIFFPFTNQTYNTYVNAFTYHGMTTYPLSSLSEDQMMTMMDYYLSGVFEPLLYTEPKLAEREAWRYELSDADADFNIAGTVYSEMQGALTLSAQASNNNMKTLYEGSTTAHVSGGIPEAVRTLTYEELVKFHDTYYHPSNALITLYGNLDVNAFLSYIDSEYLSQYDKKDITVDLGVIEPYTETKYAEYTVPVEKGAETKDASTIYYSFALNGAELYDISSMNIILPTILQESSPVMQEIRKKLPNAQIGGGLNFDSPSAPYVAMIAEGVNPEDRDLFVKAVDDGLMTLASEGISREALDSVLAANKLALKTTQEDQDLGIHASTNIALGWVYFHDVSYYPTVEEAIQNMTAEKADTLIEQYLTENLHRAVSVTKPEEGLAEKNAAALAEELKAKKDAMSEDEINQMVKHYEEYTEWANTPASSEIMSKLIHMKVANLPEEQKHYDITDEMKQDVRYLSTPVEVNGVLSAEMLLDGSTIPIEQLQDVQTCMDLFGQLDTKAHAKEEVSTLIVRYLPEFSTTLQGTRGYQGHGYYAAEFSWMGLKEDAKPAADLLVEILFDTDFSDIATIKSLLARWNSDFLNSVDNDPLNIQLQRAEAMVNDYCAYREYISNYALYQHSLELIALADTDPEALTDRLEKARTLLLNRTGATVLLAGDQDSIAAYQDGIGGIMDQMTAESREKVDYSSLRIPRKHEAIINNSTVQMNVLSTAYDGYSGKDAVVKKLIEDTYLLPRLRNVLGAYGAFSRLSYITCDLFTYRDPNLDGSYEIFEELPEYLRTADLTQEDVDSYIIGSYSNLSRPEGVLTGAIVALKNPLLGRTEETQLQWMREAKATTVEDVRASADQWDQLIKDGVRSSSGTESTLKSSGDLFDVFIYPNSKK